MLGVTPQTLSSWNKSGCPVQRVGRRNYYDLDGVRAWMSAQSVTGNPGRPPIGAERDQPADKGLSGASDERLRRLAREADVALKQAKAEKERLGVQKARGELVSSEEVIREHAEVVSRVRSRILGVPGSLAGPLAQERDPRRVESMLDDHLRAILEALGT